MGCAPAVPIGAVSPWPAPRRRRWVRQLLARAVGRFAGGGDHPGGSRPGGAHGGPPDTPRTVGELYLARRLALVRLAVLLVDDLPTAEDVVQDAFTALYRRYGTRLADLDNAAAYLHTAVVNGSRSVLRRRRTVRGHVPPRLGHAPPPEERLLMREEHQRVLAALHRLGTRQREVLVLRYWSDFTEAQIADTLGVSRGAVKSTASRALDALHRLLEER